MNNGRFFCLLGKKLPILSPFWGDFWHHLSLRGSSSFPRILGGSWSRLLNSSSSRWQNIPYINFLFSSFCWGKKGTGEPPKVIWWFMVGDFEGHPYPSMIFVVFLQQKRPNSKRRKSYYLSLITTTIICRFGNWEVETSQKPIFSSACLIIKDGGL